LNKQKYNIFTAYTNFTGENARVLMCVMVVI
jgi:hypothetical protein